jgi:hypothetical protein
MHEFAGLGIDKHGSSGRSPQPFELVRSDPQLKGGRVTEPRDYKFRLLPFRLVKPDL